jgi:hypothetical protein
MLFDSFNTRCQLGSARVRIDPKLYDSYRPHIGDTFFRSGNLKQNSLSMSIVGYAIWK